MGVNPFLHTDYENSRGKIFKKYSLGIRTVFERVRQIFLSPKTGIIFGIFICAGIAAYAVWYSSAGRFPAFPLVNNDYIELGESFLHGQLSLLEQPSPWLMRLENPYDFEQREQNPYHWDASYYQGKYYLYWGPAPALVFAAIEGISRVQPSASLVILIPYIGLAIILQALFTLISKRFFPAASSLSPGLFTVAGVVNLPIIFLLGNPQIYHTSIIFGQFFLLLGLLGWMIYVYTEKSVGLLMAGLSWGLAIGSRYNLGISVAIYLVFALIWMKRETGWKSAWKRAGFLLIPLALCLLGLGIYNFLRFGNPLEVGQTYQLTLALPRNLYFSLSYLRANLYIYLTYPLSLLEKFPFVKTALFDWTYSFLPAWLNAPSEMMYDHYIYGIFPSAPALWLSVVAIPLFVLAGIKRQIHPLPNSKRMNFFAMVTWAGGAQFLFLMVYFHFAERFAADFYIPFILTIAMLVWKMDEVLQSRGKLRLVFWMIVVGLTVWTAGLGFFSGFGVPPKIFRSFNQTLYNDLASFWNYAAEIFRIFWGNLIHFMGLQ